LIDSAARGTQRRRMRTPFARSKVSLAALAFTVAGGGAALADGPRVHAGAWHITVTREMVGLPFTPPPTSLVKCITPDDAADPRRVIKAHSEDCDGADVKVDGNHVTFSMTCHKNGHTQTGRGEMTYAGDSYTGTMTVDMNNPRTGEAVHMVEHIQAQRTGDCGK
jgi:hypothetical protein